MKKIISLFCILFLIIATNQCFAAWDASKPADNEKLKDAPALIRANWDAIATGTDSSLQITNAKVAASAAIADTKLATISTAGKVSGAALTSLSSTPSGAGPLPIANGGTGQSTATAGTNALLPSQTSNSGKSLITDGSNTSWGYPAGLTISSAAQGDVLYYTGSAWARLAAGTSGYILSTQGAGANPQWVAPFSLPSQTGNSGKFLTTNGSSPSWAIELNTSNVIFAWSGKMDGSATSYAIATDSLNPITTAVAQSRYFYFKTTNSTGYDDVIKSKFTKISGISTITWYARGVHVSAGTNRYLDVKVDIGGLNSHNAGINAGQTPTWVSNTIDVSGLTNGTTYDITVSIGVGSSEVGGGLGNIILIAS